MPAARGEVHGSPHDALPDDPPASAGARVVRPPRAGRGVGNRGWVAPCFRCAGPAPGARRAGVRVAGGRRLRQRAADAEGRDQPTRHAGEEPEPVCGRPAVVHGRDAAVRVPLGRRTRGRRARPARRGGPRRRPARGAQHPDQGRRLHGGRGRGRRPRDRYRDGRRRPFRERPAAPALPGCRGQCAPGDHLFRRRERPARDHRGRGRERQHDRRDAAAQAGHQEVPVRAAPNRPRDADRVQRQRVHARAAGCRPRHAAAGRGSPRALGRHRALRRDRAGHRSARAVSRDGGCWWCSRTARI